MRAGSVIEVARPAPGTCYRGGCPLASGERFASYDASGPTMSAIRKRPEIDGLRAVAVVPVVLYHAGLGCSGGYVGVDVFFVISGYLISALILAEIAKGEFRLTTFWERRVRRILPALAIVVLACIGLGWRLLVPSDFNDFGRSVLYQSLLMSNVFFFRTINYFTASDTQPLLHTWSLAVEEQFYLFFPLLLFLLTRLRTAFLRVFLASLAAGSLGVSIWATYAHPAAAFYLLPYRAWELLLGSLLAAAPDLWPKSKWRNECLSWIGLGAILFASITYNDETRFPGMSALVPCLGALFLIGSNSSDLTRVGKLLATRPFVFVGLISYSLYLWHWPLLVYAKYRQCSDLSILQGIGVAVGSLLLAAVSWKLVEMPFRNRTILRDRRQIFAFAAITFALLIGCGAGIRRSNGLRARWRPDALQYIDGQNDKDFRIELGYEQAVAGVLTEIGSSDPARAVGALVWGDSHAMALLHVVDFVCKEAGVRALAATHSATAPLLHFPSTTRYSLHERSVAYNQAILDVIRARHINKVVLAAAWNVYARDAATSGQAALFEQSLRETLDALQSIGAVVFIVKDVPKQPFEVPRALALAAQGGRDVRLLGLSAAEYREQGVRANDLFDRLASRSVVVLDPTPILTDANGICSTERDGKVLYFDKHHLSTHGAMQLRPMFEQILAEGGDIEHGARADRQGFHGKRGRSTAIGSKLHSAQSGVCWAAER